MESCALYLRVSTEEQAGEGHASLDVQRLRCEEYAARHGWIVAEVYHEAESAFGNGHGRAAFKAMVAGATTGRFSHVVVFNASRFSRTAFETLQVVEQLRRAGVQVHSTAEDLTNFLMLGIQAVINEVESRRISERVKPSLQHMAAQGLWPRGHPRPFGFQFAPDKILRHDPIEAPRVRELFERYYAGSSLSRLVAECKASGKGPVGLTSMRWLLRNPLYAGRIHWNGVTYPGKHDPIVEPSLFDRVQEMMIGRYQHHEPAVWDYAIAGLLKCWCGYRMYLERRKGRRPLFVCHSKGRAERYHQQIDAEWAETTVRAALGKLTMEAQSIETIIAEAERQHQERAGQSGAQRAELQRRLNSYRDRQERLTDYLLDGTVARDVYLREMPRLESEIASLERHLAALPPQVAFDAAPLRSALERLPELLRTTEPTILHEALRLFVEHIIATNNPPRLEIVWAGRA